MRPVVMVSPVWLTFLHFSQLLGGDVDCLPGAIIRDGEKVGVKGKVIIADPNPLLVTATCIPDFSGGADGGDVRHNLTLTRRASAGL